jgi:hypothetical protein
MGALRWTVASLRLVVDDPNPPSTQRRTCGTGPQTEAESVRGVRVNDQVVDCMVDIHGGWYMCFRLLLVGKLISAKTIGETGARALQ